MRNLERNLEDDIIEKCEEISQYVDKAMAAQKLEQPKSWRQTLSRKLTSKRAFAKNLISNDDPQMTKLMNDLNLQVEQLFKSVLGRTNNLEHNTYDLDEQLEGMFYALGGKEHTSSDCLAIAMDKAREKITETSNKSDVQTKKPEL